MDARPRRGIRAARAGRGSLRHARPAGSPRSPPRRWRTVDLEGLGLDRGGHLLVERALGGVAPGARVEVRGRDPNLGVHLRGVVPRARARLRYRRARACSRSCAARRPRRGGAAPSARGGAAPAGVVDRPPARWGLAARGALVEAGAPGIDATLADKAVVWSDDAPGSTRRPRRRSGIPRSAIPWADARELPAEVEDAVVQVMTYLVENETAALLVPARFLGRIHPHFREVMAVLAVQVADEARHIEVFTRRALLHRGELGLSSAGGQASLATLLDEPDFALASFLLSVLGEGSFLSLLWFLHAHAPDPVTRRGRAARGAGRGPPRRLRPLAPRAARGRSSRISCLGSPPPSSAATRRSGTRPGLNEEVFDALDPARRRRAGSRRPSRAGTTRCSRCSATWTRAGSAGCAASASGPRRPRRSPRSTRATSCDPGGRAGAFAWKRPRAVAQGRHGTALEAARGGARED